MPARTMPTTPARRGRGDARRDALAWLAGRLAWERTLERLRTPARSAPPARRAA
jgi:hypothetical protein